MKSNGKALKPIDKLRGQVKAMRSQLEAALAGRLDPDYFIRVLTTTVQKNPDLLQCDRVSLLGAVTECAQLGLIPDGVTGYAYIVPFDTAVKLPNGQKEWRKLAQTIPGYKGLIQLAYRGGKVTKVVAREVFEHDEFEYAYGTEEYVRHVPVADGERGPITHFYAIAWQAHGPPIFRVLRRSDVDLIRDGSKGKNSKAWRENYPSMGCKTAIRALYRYLPVDAEAQRVAAQDEAFDAGVDDARDVDAEVVTSLTDELNAEIEGGGEESPGPPAEDVDDDESIFPGPEED